MNKKTKASLLLCLVLVLLCLSIQVHVTEARHLGDGQKIDSDADPPMHMPVFRSPPCGSNIGSQIMAQSEEPCRQISRPLNPRKGKIPKPHAARVN
ncbi:hypothetical protein EUTSA_v10019374mg [Eutrema salsugineum]|uniref:Uncharacterized protein n=1 Tax=Eutrema salsugineum TaxID=72664 RepID=V4KMS5_EUTSA|nr:hypothetical protein EUTSA_v10019374mg [Eutrema salsugineum]